MILTLKELAEYLRVNERTILRMLKTEQVQGAKIGGQWRFNSRQIDSLFFPESDVPEGGEHPLVAMAKSHIGIPLSRMMHEDRIHMELQAENSKDVINELIEPRTLNPYVYDVHDLREKCLAREALLSTGVGNGIAVPHPRDPVPTLRASGIVIVGRSKKGVDFGAVDGKPVHLFFLMCCQNIELHLHLMGRLAHVLKTEGFSERCLACEQPEEIIRLVMEVERTDFLR